MLLPLIGAGLGGFEGYRRSGGDIGATVLGAGLGAVTPGALRMAGTALGGLLGTSGLGASAATGLTGQAAKLAQVAAAQAGTFKGGLAASGAQLLSSAGKAAVDPRTLGKLAAGAGTFLGAPALAGALASKVAPAGQATGQAAANLAANALGYPQGYGQGATYNEAAINAGLTPSGYVDAYGNPLDIGNPLGTAAGRRLEFAKGIEQQRAAMQMLGPEIYKAKEAAARQELQRQLTAAGVRENIATQGAMLRQAQLGAQQVGAQAASQMGSALTQQYQYS